MMRRRTPVVAAVVAGVIGGLTPAVATATPVSGLLFGENGTNTFNDRLDCGAQNGAGDTWRAFWFDQPATDPNGVFSGRWNGDFEVHRGLAPGSAFVPGNSGRIALAAVSSGGRLGAGFFDTAGTQGCDDANLQLTPLGGSDPSSQQVSGQLPIVATGGLGALRGLTGSGTIDMTLDLSPGADNPATIALAGNFDVLDPDVKVGSAQARWDSLTAWLNKRLRIYVTLTNPAGAGDAFGVRITGANANGGKGFEGVPSGPVTVLNGGGATIQLVLKGANPGQKYTVNVQAAVKDGLLADQPPIGGSFSFTAPLLP